MALTRRIVVVGMWLTLPASGFSQSVDPAGRTPWGDPDLQGVWTNTTTTPLERPATLSDRATLTEEERAGLDEEAVRNADGVPGERDTGSYNSFWLEKGRLSEQTSLIVDPDSRRLRGPLSNGSTRSPPSGSSPQRLGTTSMCSTAVSRGACREP